MRGDGARPVVLHERDRSLLSRATHGTMLSSYAHHPVYLIVDRVHGRYCSHRVQMGGREWRHPLQRPASRERTESAAGGSADVFGTSTRGGTRFLAAHRTAVPCSRIPELRAGGASERSDSSECLVHHGKRAAPSYTARGRSGLAAPGWDASTGFGHYGPFLHDPGRARLALAAGGSAGQRRPRRVPVLGRHVPRSAAFAVESTESDSQALTIAVDTAAAVSTKSAMERRGVRLGD